MITCNFAHPNYRPYGTFGNMWISQCRGLAYPQPMEGSPIQPLSIGSANPQF